MVTHAPLRARIVVSMPSDPIPDLKRQAAAALVPLVQGWARDDIAELLGTERERIPELVRGKLDRFSLDRLIRFLVRAGARVELRITPQRAPPSRRRCRFL